jgi:hypothetical protein
MDGEKLLGGLSPKGKENGMKNGKTFEASDLAFKKATEINSVVNDIQNEMDQLVADYYREKEKRNRCAFAVMDKDKNGTLEIGELVAALVPGFYDDISLMPGYEVQLALGIIDKKTLEKAKKAACGCAQQ